MKKKYKSKFFESRDQDTSFSAKRILSIIMDALPQLNSAIDFGCGVGTWLSVLREKGIKDIQGMDGPWINEDLLVIPQEDFRHVDFRQSIDLDRKYDLAISLEVAEHLEPRFARTFVRNLSNASDFILFSAAIPFQGGRNHFNEQWPSYWASLFHEHGYILMDFIRKEIWNEKSISTWYRQNTLFFVQKERTKDIRLTHMAQDTGQQIPLDLVHPDLFQAKMKKMYTFKGTWKSFRRTLKQCITN